jgi:predicted TPR repeat methyltransferase
LKTDRNIECADIFAPNYDKVVPSKGWCAPDIIYGLMSDRVCSGETLLDIGIGTGLSAVPFKEAGLTIYGVDGSEEMIKICASKEIAKKLDICDLSHGCLPYKDFLFNHVVSAGVFHLLGDLNQLFSEVIRVLRKGGLFSFTVDERIKGSSHRGAYLCGGNIEEYVNPDSNIASYTHSGLYIADLLFKNDLRVISKKQFHAYDNSAWADDVYFNAYLTEK